MCKFRKRLGPEGTEKVETLVRDQLRKDKRIAPSMRVDTTAMEKHIAYPTDEGFLQKVRVRLTRLIKKMEALAADRGYRSQGEREPDLLEQVPQMAIPRKGKTQGPNEQTAWFKRLTARRVGLEAIISHRKKRPRYKGWAGNHLNVPWRAHQRNQS